jgi:trehalose 6-phosphate phosphatase
MSSILSPEGAAALDALARDRSLLAFDFDGTLAPLVDDRTAAALSPATRELLRVAALLYPTVVVSGRARADLAPRLDGVPLLAAVASHGAEPGFGPVDRSRRAEVGAWADALRAHLAHVRGVELEDKGLSLAIHFRRAADPESAGALARRAAEALPGARVFGGHLVVNAVPDDAPTKGDAVVELLARTGCRTALYVGDDTTDEEAFRAPGVVVSVRIGARAGTAAAWSLAAQHEVDALLAALVAARRRCDGRGAAVDGLVRAIRAA